MSTDYEIRCACGDHFSYDNWRRPQEVRGLLALREHFTAIGKALDKSEVGHLYGWDAFNSMFPSVFYFFASHEGHEMQIFDEYGRRWTEEYDRKRNEIYKELRGADKPTQDLLYAQLRDLDLEQETPR